jgi:sugar phosphate permease
MFAVGRGCMGPVVMGGVSLILNNSAPRATLGAVNGFAGTFTNLARAAAPLTAGALIAGGDTTPNRGGADARR